MRLKTECVLFLFTLSCLALATGKFFQSDTWGDAWYMFAMVVVAGINLGDLIAVARRTRPSERVKEGA